MVGRCVAVLELVNLRTNFTAGLPHFYILDGFDSLEPCFAGIKDCLLVGFPRTELLPASAKTLVFLHLPKQIATVSRFHVYI